ncbi:uncharacterized protein IL334_004176 [Kwoniella shivajii]|uniref:Uncharacterized protein n=1 Tax=Kwoniella shivajii TaxID=564305 RepID=A0ABZ1CZL3_9TREE|nr:hypothetical protein IL334_004176 [Kwoniella shivajii]
MEPSVTSPGTPPFQSGSTVTPDAVQIRQAYKKEPESTNMKFVFRPDASSFTPSSSVHPYTRTSKRSLPRKKGFPSYQALTQVSEEGNCKHTPAGREIIGHANDANQHAAASLRALLMGEENKEEVATEPSSQLHTQLNVESPSDDCIRLVPSVNAVSHPTQDGDLLNRAFQQEYSQDWRFRDISRIPDSDQEEIWKEQNNHLLLGNENDTTPSQLNPVQQEIDLPPCKLFRDSSVSSHTASQADSSQYTGVSHSRSERLTLHGLGEGRSRNEYGRNLNQGQEHGHGVIGNATPITDGAPTTVVVSEAGCDIPMIREPWTTQAQLPREGREDIITNIGGHKISFDPDLPPLAIEHPARVWNSMIHSLSSELQPVIKWDYEKILPQQQGDDTFWLAQLTLVLPPSHPSIAEHSLFPTLPKNRYKKEYVASVESLGGIKRWVGEPKKLKADAQNTTLVKCISENALAWVLAPNGIRIAAESDDDDENDLAPPFIQGAASTSETAAVDIQHHPSSNGINHIHPSLRTTVKLPPSQPLANYSVPPEKSDLTQCQDSEEIKIDEVDLDIHSVVASQTPLVTPRLQETVARDGRFNPFQRFMDFLHMTLGPGGICLHNPVSFSSHWEPFTNKFGCTLTVGTSVNNKVYQEQAIYNYADEAQNAVCKKALDLNVEGFMNWLKESLAPNLWDSTSLLAPSYPEEIVVRPPLFQHYQPPILFSSRAESTWQTRLKSFCTKSGPRSPRYHEQLFSYEGTDTLVSGVTIGDDTFSIPKNSRTDEEAREYLARRVLVDHFHQKPGHDSPLMVSKTGAMRGIMSS